MRLLGALALFAIACSLYFFLRRLATVRKAELASGHAGWQERRRNERRRLNGTVGVYGHGLAQQPFYDKANIRDVSESGGLLHLRVPVHNGQQLLVINDATSEENIGRVVRVHIDNDKTFEVALEFLKPSLEFWRRVDQ